MTTRKSFLRILLLAILLIVSLTPIRAQIDTSAMRQAIKLQVDHYPELRLQDVYKTFYQDRFGPGHLITDTALVIQYLNKELNDFPLWMESVPAYEPTGFQGNFVRVYLSCLTVDGISARTLTDAFVRSSKVKIDMPISWKEEWQLILQIIEEENLQMPDYEQDSTKIEEMLATGDHAITHSKNYKAHYDPHYRIVSREIFEKEFLPLIKR
ncbi:MAG: hypothetical protein K6A41_02785 [Bacteroidales bacterium]|nr:hypothetical protein [Bacteroidales bacterium]